MRFVTLYMQCTFCGGKCSEKAEKLERFYIYKRTNNSDLHRKYCVVCKEFDKINIKSFYLLKMLASSDAFVCSYSVWMGVRGSQKVLN